MFNCTLSGAESTLPVPGSCEATEADQVCIHLQNSMDYVLCDIQCHYLHSLHALSIYRLLRLKERYRDIMNALVLMYPHLIR